MEPVAKRLAELGVRLGTFTELGTVAERRPTPATGRLPGVADRLMSAAADLRSAAARTDPLSVSL